MDEALIDMNECLDKILTIVKTKDLETEDHE